jgi:hypothetical protein
VWGGCPRGDGSLAASPAASPPKARKARAKTAPPPPQPKPPKEPSRWEVERIVEESGAWGGHKRWFLVEWKGYSPSWEKWRVQGEVGSPIATWEPLRRMSRTQALKE